MYMEKVMAPHSSTLAWQIPWTEEPGRLQSMGSLGVGDDWATSLSCIEEGNSNSLQYSCLEDPRDGGAWWAAICGVAQSQTRLKWLSSSMMCTAYLSLIPITLTKGVLSEQVNLSWVASQKYLIESFLPLQSAKVWARERGGLVLTLS